MQLLAYFCQHLAHSPCPKDVALPPNYGGAPPYTSLSPFPPSPLTLHIFCCSAELTLRCLNQQSSEKLI